MKLRNRIASVAAAAALVFGMAVPAAMAFPTECTTGVATKAYSYCNSGYGQHRVRAKSGSNQGEWWYVYGPWRTPSNFSFAGGPYSWDPITQKTH